MTNSSDDHCLVGDDATWQDIRKFLKRLTRDDATADELLQELRCRVLKRRLVGSDVVEEPRRFLRTAARNLFIEHFRLRERRAEDTLDDADARAFADPQPSPEDRLHHERWTRIAGRAIRELVRTPLQRRLIQSWFEPARVAASRLGTTPDAVRRLKVRLRARLRQSPHLRRLLDEAPGHS